MSNDKVIYEPHPVSDARKKELRGQGYTIIDAQFAPEGYEHPDGGKKTPGGALNVGQLKEALTAAGVQFADNAKKADLQALYDQIEKE